VEVLDARYLIIRTELADAAAPAAPAAAPDAEGGAQEVPTARDGARGRHLNGVHPRRADRDGPADAHPGLPRRWPPWRRASRRIRGPGRLKFYFYINLLYKKMY
jgi:hypothetical protein